MCTPLIMGVASFGLGIAQAVGGYMQASQAATNQDRMYEQNKANAQAAFSSEQDTLQQRQVQEDTAAAQRSFDMNQEYVRARETSENASANRGQSGLSIEALTADLDIQEETRQANAAKSLEWTLADLQRNKEASGANYVSNVNSVQKGEHPSFGNLALGIVGAGLQGYNDYGSAKTRLK